MTPKEKTGRYKYIRYIICYGVLSLLFLIFFLWNINAGSVDLSVKEIAEILFFHSGDEMEYGIVWKIRLPRIIAAAVLGGALALAGFLMQIFFRNPIAGPFVLGISFIVGAHFIRVCRFPDYDVFCTNDFRKGGNVVSAGGLRRYGGIYLFCDHRFYRDFR